MKRIAVALALVVGLAGVGLLTACRTMGVNGLTRTGKKDIDVYLVAKDGICQVTEPVEGLGGSKGAKISWTVHNACPDAEYVTLGEYKEYLTGGGFGTVDPNVINPDPAASGSIPTNGSERVRGKITKEGRDNLRFKYTICVAKFGEAAKCLDPDVDVWP